MTAQVGRINMRSDKWVAVGLMLLILFSGSCSMNGDHESASTETLRRLLDVQAGSIYGYTSLADQMLDSDAVVIGPITGVESSGSELPDDGSYDPIEYMNVVIDVTEVIHTSPETAVEPGSVIKIATFLPEQMSISEANQAIPDDNLGIHFLFDAATLRERLGEPIGNAEGRWIYQNTNSVVLRGENGEATAVDGPPAQTSLTTFSDFVSTARTDASSISGLQRPTAPIGLEPATATQ